MAKYKRSKKIAVIGDTISSHPEALDGGALPRSIVGLSNFPWLTDRLEKLGYVYNREESIKMCMVIYTK